MVVPRWLAFFVGGQYWNRDGLLARKASLPYRVYLYYRQKWWRGGFTLRQWVCCDD